MDWSEARAVHFRQFEMNSGSLAGIVGFNPLDPARLKSVRPCFLHSARKRPLGKKAVEVVSSGGLI